MADHCNTKADSWNLDRLPEALSTIQATLIGVNPALQAHEGT